MTNKQLLLLLLLTNLFFNSCKSKTQDVKRTALLEVEGKFLYLDELKQIIPPNVNDSDSTKIASSFIQKWVTEVLMYENAKRNIVNQSEIDELVEIYRKSLTIHQYQQKLIEQRLPKEASEEELKEFYEKYSNQLLLKENVIKGLLLIVPEKAPKMSAVRSWVQSANLKSLENIEKYSIQNAISYDYFGDRWLPFSEVLKKIPIQVGDPTNFIASNRFIEKSDSVNHYFLRITGFSKIGQVEPYEMAKEKIATILLNKHKADFILKFENELYDDAVKKKIVTFIKK
jgi:hypothetical protein